MATQIVKNSRRYINLTRRPQTYQEYFNMKQTCVRNVIEQTFGLLKMCWGILRSPLWYSVKTHNQIIMV
ncbi:hypothetical protein ACS0TY_004245 [Phlomoides rotata]